MSNGHLRMRPVEQRAASNRSRHAPPPVFIIGAPRSGTSLLYRALALHPKSAWINNYQRRAASAAPLAALNRIVGAAPATTRSVWFGRDGDNAYRYGAERTWRDRWFPQPVEGEPIFRRRAIPEQVSHRPPSQQQLRLRQDFQRLARYSGGQVVLSKRIGHNLRIPLLHGIFPEARFIDLTRDGRAVAASLVRVDWWGNDRLWWCDQTPHDLVATGREPVLVAAEHWVWELDAIAAGAADIPAEQLLRLKYEELTEHPIDVLQQAASFAGLPESDRWVDRLSGLRFPNQNSTWSDRLGEHGAAVTALQHSQLRASGYVE